MEAVSTLLQYALHERASANALMEGNGIAYVPPPCLTMDQICKRAGNRPAQQLGDNRGSYELVEIFSYI